jgi:SAM-dependent methyltransferase
MTSDSSSAAPSRSIEGADKWHARYRDQRPVGPFPTEWVIRTIAGANYPRMKLDKSKYPGAAILDLGCGDGRNLPLLLSLGFQVSAIEISEPLVDDLRQLGSSKNWPVAFSVGHNTSIPYGPDSFDYILACATLYYLEDNRSWSEVMTEVSRVLKPGGILIANFPDVDNAVLAGAESLPDGTLRIQNDPFGLRNGLRFVVPRDQDDVERLLRPWFEPIGVGSQKDDFYGLMVSGYIFTARKV